MSGRDILDVEKYKRGGHGMLEGGRSRKEVVIGWLSSKE